MAGEIISTLPFLKVIAVGRQSQMGVGLEEHEFFLLAALKSLSDMESFVLFCFTIEADLMEVTTSISRTPRV